MTRSPLARLAASCAIAALVLAPVVLIPSKIVDDFRPTNTDPYPFPSSAGQSFVAPADRLSSVGFFLYFTRQFPGTAQARMVLTREDTGAVVRTTSREVAASVRIPSHIFRPTYFDFAPVDHARGIDYRATLAFSEPGVALWGAPGDLYGGGTAWVSGLPDAFDFSFATRHDGTLAERLGRLSRWAPLWLVLPGAVATLALLMGAASVASLLATSPGVGEGATETATAGG